MSGETSLATAAHLRDASGDNSRVAEGSGGLPPPSPLQSRRAKGRVRGVDGARTRFVKRPVVDVCFTPREIRPVEVAVVVDVLRATSTIVQALGVGYPRVVCCRSVATARDLRTPGRVLAGERACMRVPDFELGNSPAAMATAGRRGEELVLATTYGSPAVVAAARAAERVLVASLLNLGAVVAAVPTGAGVAIVCSGTDGRPGRRARGERVRNAARAARRERGRHSAARNRPGARYRLVCPRVRPRSRTRGLVDAGRGGCRRAC